MFIIRVMGRATQGVRVINLKPGDKVSDLAKLEGEEEGEGGDEKVEWKYTRSLSFLFVFINYNLEYNSTNYCYNSI